MCHAPFLIDCLYVLTVSAGTWIWHKVLVGGLTAQAYFRCIQEETGSQTDRSVGTNESEYDPVWEYESISCGMGLSGPGRGNLLNAGFSAATRSARRSTKDQDPIREDDRLLKIQDLRVGPRNAGV
jgi:hypothetical protein